MVFTLTPEQWHQKDQSENTKQQNGNSWRWEGTQRQLRSSFGSSLQVWLFLLVLNVFLIFPASSYSCRSCVLVAFQCSCTFKEAQKSKQEQKKETEKRRSQKAESRKNREANEQKSYKKQTAKKWDGLRSRKGQKPETQATQKCE